MAIPYAADPGLPGLDRARPRRAAGDRHAVRPPHRADAGAAASLRGLGRRATSRCRSICSRRLGARRLVVTNAAGRAEPGRSPPARSMLIEDHLNFTGANPLDRPQRRGARRCAFPTSVRAYDPGPARRGAGGRGGGRGGAAARDLCRRRGPVARDLGRAALAALDRRRRGRHVDGDRGDRRRACRAAGARHIGDQQRRDRRSRSRQPDTIEAVLRRSRNRRARTSRRCCASCCRSCKAIRAAADRASCGGVVIREAPPAECPRRRQFRARPATEAGARAKSVQIVIKTTERECGFTAAGFYGLVTRPC